MWHHGQFDFDHAGHFGPDLPFKIGLSHLCVNLCIFNAFVSYTVLIS